jgi:hypothetical protein
LEVTDHDFGIDEVVTAEKRLGEGV